MNEFDTPDSPLHRLIRDSFGDVEIVDIADAGQGRGIFSRVVRVELEGAAVRSVVVKAPALGVNGSAARASGAYFREALAYRSLLAGLKVRTPACFRVADMNGDPWFVLEDLSEWRSIDQLDGISLQDSLRFTTVLAELHGSHVGEALAGQLRGPGPERFALATLAQGLASLQTRWQQTDTVHRAFERLLDRRESLVRLFVETGRHTLCHGDPRADNVVLSDAEMILLDWQQVSMSFGEADLAWLMATSATVSDRPTLESAVLQHYARIQSRSLDQVSANYRVGMTRPGLAVLMLATRDTTDTRTHRLVKTSLERIGNALADLEIGDD